jgi:hypothetical protein
MDRDLQIQYTCRYREISSQTEIVERDLVEKEEDDI